MTGNAKIIISKEAIKQNCSILKQYVSKDTTISAVIKADAYGMGANKVAPILYKDGIKDFFVANLEEAFNIKKALRKKDINIYILYNLNNNNLKKMIKNKFTPVLNTIEDISLWHRKGKNKPCVINIDTGLSRLGINAKEIKELKKEDIFNDLNISYVMSHFSSANSIDDKACEEEYKSFLKLIKFFPKDCKFSLANSGGTFRNKKYHFDMIRVGRTFYGLSPLENKDLGLQNSMRLQARILQIRELNKGEYVGYLRSHKTSRKSTVAVLNIGYADSLLRSHSNKGYLYFNGVKLPIIGLISMDVAMVDITDVKDHTLKQGDYIEVIGKSQSVDEFAKSANTNGCEILTSLSTRYEWIIQDSFDTK